MSERAYVVRLTIADNEAYTALTTLARMGLPIDGIERGDVWVASAKNEPWSALDALIPRLETIFNPNKHRLEVRADAEPRPGEVWVTARDESAATTVAAEGSAVPLVRWTSWRLLDEHGRAVDPVIRDRAVASFLCNPAFQHAKSREPS